MTKQIKAGDVVYLERSNLKYTVFSIIDGEMCVLSRPSIDGVDYSWECHNNIKYTCRPMSKLTKYVEPPKYKSGDKVCIPGFCEYEVITVKERPGLRPVYILANWEDLNAEVYTEQEIEERV